MFSSKLWIFAAIFLFFGKYLLVFTGNFSHIGALKSEKLENVNDAAKKYAETTRGPVF